VRFSERRKYPRYGFQSDVEIVFGSETRRAFITDISIGGMFVITETPLLVGSPCKVRLLFTPPLELDCVVRRVIPSRGMGMEIQRPSDVARVRLERLITSLVNP
jgi:hypothetical protein